MISNQMHEFTIERGTIADYRALAHLHYRAGSPGGITTIHRLLHRRQRSVDLIGVLVRSLPHLASRARNLALGDRYTALDRSEAARALNTEIRTISRVIIDPRYRGLGLAVQLVRRALDEPETPYTEAFAAMGRVHPFFERAGMVRYDPPPDPAEAHLSAALERFALDPALLASRRAWQARTGRLSATDRGWLRRELRRHTSTPRAASDHVALARAAHRLLARPVYYLAHHATHTPHQSPHKDSTHAPHRP